MRAFLFPHQLLAPEIIYTAAMHQNKAVALAAFGLWALHLNVEEITYHQHKPISLIATRFAPQLAGIPHGGVLQNIGRQGRLRAHANLDTMRKLLARPKVGALGLVALGNLRARLMAPADIAGDLDALELCLPLQGWKGALETLAAEGWLPVAPPVSARGRRAMVAHLGHSAVQTKVRLLGLAIKPAALEPVEGLDGLQRMSDDAHRRFMQSRQASLLLRRDQILFDIFSARYLASLSGGPCGIDLADVSFFVRSAACRVLGTAQ